MAENIITTEQLLGTSPAQDVVTSEQLFGGDLSKPKAPDKIVYASDTGQNIGIDAETHPLVAQFDILKDYYGENPTKIIGNYVKEGQDAFKWVASGMPRDFESIYDIEEGGWDDVITKAYPELSDPDSKLAQSTIAQFGVMFAGGLVEAGTKPSSFIIAKTLQHAIPAVVKGTLKRLPNSWQRVLNKDLKFPQQVIDRVKGETAGVKYRILKAFGVQQETALATMTDAQVQEAVAAGRMTEGQAARISKAVKTQAQKLRGKGTGEGQSMEMANAVDDAINKVSKGKEVTSIKVMDEVFDIAPETGGVKVPIKTAPLKPEVKPDVSVPLEQEALKAIAEGKSADEFVDSQLDDVAQTQRGTPEASRLPAFDISYLQGDILEFAGDLIHRMYESPKFFEGQNAHAKLRGLKSRLRTESIKEINESIQGKEEQLKPILENYANEYRNLPVYNETQQKAKDIPILIAEGKYQQAEKLVDELIDLSKDKPAWIKAITESKQLTDIYNKAQEGKAPVDDSFDFGDNTVKDVKVDENLDSESKADALKSMLTEVTALAESFKGRIVTAKLDDVKIPSYFRTTDKTKLSLDEATQEYNTMNRSDLSESEFVDWLVNTDKERINIRADIKTAKEKPAPISLEKYTVKGYSTHYNRIKGKFGFEGDIKIDTITLKNQEKKAFEFAQKNPQKAMQVAYGIVEAPKGVFPDSVRSVVMQSLIADNKVAQAEDIARRMSKSFTEAAQTLNIAKLNVSSSTKIRHNITNSRIEKIGKELGEVKDPQKAVEQKVKTEAKKYAKNVNKEINTNKTTIQEIDDLIGELIC